MFKYILFLFLFITPILSHTQTKRQNTSNFNAWFMYFGNHKISSKWGLNLEMQLRRNDFISNPQQLLFRPGINYYISPSATATLGYAFIETYPYGAFPVKIAFPENRLWQQMQLKNQLGRFEVISRFRLEQRWLHLPVPSGDVFTPGDAVYQNRFRVLNRFSIPFKGKVIADKSFYFSAYDELFVSFGKKVGLNVFDQNRIYLAFGYRFPKIGRLEIGYLSQILTKSDGLKVENNNTLQIGLSSNINFYKARK